MRITSWVGVVGAAALAMAAAVAVAQPPGNATKGAEVYDDVCSSCHVIGGVGQGPSLAGVVGRRAGSVPGFEYTAALKGSGIVWTPAQLNRWLEGPGKLVPGTAMQQVVSNPTQRSDLIAYLATLKR